MERTVEANGVKVHYADEGAGPPIVLLHGGLMTGQAMWSTHLPALVRGHRVLVPDTRGHGSTDNPSGELTYAAMADDVAAFVAALGLERPLVVGYSDGGQTALELALRHPGVAGALVLGGIVGEPDERYRDVLRELGMAVPGRFDEARFERTVPGFLDLIKQLHGPGWATLMERTSRLWHDVRVHGDDELARIDVPTLVLTGDRDEPSMTQAPLIARAVRSGEVAVIPGAGHEAVERELFADIVLDFAERVGAPAQLPTRQIEGRDIGSTISLILVATTEVGAGPRRHRHPYDETFVIRTGTAEFVIDGVATTGHGGDVLVAGKGAAHAFTNVGPGLLEMVNVHASDVIVTEWLE